MIEQSKGLLRFCQVLDRLLIEEEGQLLCYNEPTDKLHDENLRICLPKPTNLLAFITILSMFQTWTLQRNGWTHGRFQNLQQGEMILRLAWYV